MKTRKWLPTLLILLAVVLLASPALACRCGASGNNGCPSSPPVGEKFLSETTCGGRACTCFGNEDSVVRGTNGRDVICTNSMYDETVLILANRGNDIICSVVHNYDVNGFGQANGGPSVEVQGGRGNDQIIIYSSDGNSVAKGGQGNDLLMDGNGSGVELRGNSGNDTCINGQTSGCEQTYDVGNFTF